MPGASLIFEQGLAACAAGGRGGGRLLHVGIEGRDGYHLELGIGIIGTGVIACRPFGTRARGVGGIFLVGAGDGHAVVEQYGSSDVEAAVGGVRALDSLSGGIDKVSLYLGKLRVGF